MDADTPPQQHVLMDTSENGPVTSESSEEPKNDDPWITVKSRKSKWTPSKTPENTSMSTTTQETQHAQPTAAPVHRRLPPLPKDDYKVIFHPRETFTFARWLTDQIANSIKWASNQPIGTCTQTMIVRIEPQQNIAIASVPDRDYAIKLIGIKSLQLGEKGYAKAPRNKYVNSVALWGTAQTCALNQTSRVHSKVCPMPGRTPHGCKGLSRKIPESIQENSRPKGIAAHHSPATELLSGGNTIEIPVKIPTEVDVPCQAYSSARAAKIDKLADKNITIPTLRDELRKQLKEDRKTHARELKETRETYIREIEKIKERHTKEMKEAKEEIKAAKEEIAKRRASLAESQAVATTCKEHLASLSSESNSLPNTTPSSIEMFHQMETSLSQKLQQQLQLQEQHQMQQLQLFLHEKLQEELLAFREQLADNLPVKGKKRKKPKANSSVEDLDRSMENAPLPHDGE
ncbi:hypothetical protein HPB49_008374 [Dermacentor silvarum]|uniref:Uncharacterized protein n=1 Tax=Dermacentor silvarum TaxID=543639 RepID=A0ACB8C2Q9_DERSI|nr:hypothetical protein HPB49_008374 [Dermacentor silvarum]